MFHVYLSGRGARLWVARTRVCSAERVGLVIVFNVDQYNYQPHPLATHLDVLMFHVETLNAQTPAGGWVLCGVRCGGGGGGGGGGGKRGGRPRGAEQWVRAVAMYLLGLRRNIEDP